MKQARGCQGLNVRAGWGSRPGENSGAKWEVQLIGLREGDRWAGALAGQEQQTGGQRQGEEAGAVWAQRGSASGSAPAAKNKATLCGYYALHFSLGMPRAPTLEDVLGAKVQRLPIDHPRCSSILLCLWTLPDKQGRR